ncbi:hypothetical protein [Nocardia sp. NPDC057030]|uniref:hypothetical protein n=1 Tax=unclassified Nocardia TaxID=2637762 RepID=UPI00363C96BD
MTATSSGQKLARIFAGRELMESVRPVSDSRPAMPDSGPTSTVGAPFLSPPVIKPVGYQTGLGDKPMTREEQEAANRARREEETQRPPVPGANLPVQGTSGQPANNSVPQPNPAQQQKPAQTQPVQNPQQVPGDAVPGTDKPVDGAGQQPAPALPAEGVPWETRANNGAVATSVIVAGTGGQTIDTTIRNADGTITQMRSVSNGRGGVTTWTANADGSYSVRYPDGTNGAENGQAKIYTVPAGADPSAPAPMEADISADGKRVETPSYDPNGKRVGTDVGVLNEQGLYNNYHHDNYGNVLITAAVPNGKGGVESTLVGGIDSDGSRWHLDKAGKRWSVSDDGQGNTYLSRMEQAKDGLHWLHTNKAGLVVDEYRGKGNDWYEDTYNADGTRTRRYADKSESIFDATGKRISHNAAPDDRMAWEKLGGGVIKGATAFGGAIFDIVAYPFRKVADGMAGLSSVQATQNGIMTTYQPPDREERLAEIGGAFVRPVVGSVEYLAGNLADFMATTSSIRVGTNGIGSAYQRPDRENALMGDLIGVTPKEMRENPWESSGLLGFNVAVNAAGLRIGRGPRSANVREAVVVERAVEIEWGDIPNPRGEGLRLPDLSKFDGWHQYGAFAPLIDPFRPSSFPQFGKMLDLTELSQGFRHPTVRDVDFAELARDNIQKRADGYRSATEKAAENPSAKDQRHPLDRTLTTSRLRLDNDYGTAYDSFNFSGVAHDWTPASEVPRRPVEEERLYETSRASTYNPETGRFRDSQGGYRAHDSEPKLFEEIARFQLGKRSGLSAVEVDAAIREAYRQVFTRDHELMKEYREKRVHSPEEIAAMAIRTRERLHIAIDRLNERGTQLYGSAYKPFKAADLSGDLRLVVHLPSARTSGAPPYYQVCTSCQNVMLAFETAFPRMRMEVLNLPGERIYGIEPTS